ncbi:MAG: CPBP family intramembrane metalloprotease [Ruminococcus sp.]|nr:CPBP family intramembrane metalloprotease [Ruminococcus sp.]
MEHKTNKLTLKKALLIYIVLFYAAWAVYELVGRKYLDSAINNDLIVELCETVIKNLVWTLPAMLLIHKYSSDVLVRLKEMFTAKVNWLKYLPVFAFFTAYILFNAYSQYGEIKIQRDFGIASIIMVLFVGLEEEMVFRGWLLNATVNEDKKWRYIILNALMFLMIHFPIWIRNGIFVSSFTHFGFIIILFLSVIFSTEFLRSKNILVPIAMHMYWDLLASMFVG